MPSLKPADLKLRYKEARSEKEKLEYDLAPTISQRDKIRAERQALEDKERPLNQRIKSLRVPIIELEQELEMLKNALGGKVDG